MEKQKIHVENVPESFKEWIESLREIGYSIDIIINSSLIERVNVRIPDNGDWSDIEFGKIVMNSYVSHKEKVYKPYLMKNELVLL
jgi:hypothetical protein